jgi:hypothetical protein
LTESIRLIDTRDIGGPARLSRRRRFLRLGVDVDGDVAVTVFLRRSVSCAELEMHHLERRRGSWRLLGGGGGSADYAELVQRRTRNDLGSFGTVTAGAATFTGGGTWDGSHGRAIRSSWLQLAAEVARVDFNGRTIRVPWHSHVVVVWTGDAEQEAALLDGDGAALARLTVR